MIAPFRRLTVDAVCTRVPHIGSSSTVREKNNSSSIGSGKPGTLSGLPTRRRHQPDNHHLKVLRHLSPFPSAEVSTLKGGPGATSRCGSNLKHGPVTLHALLLWVLAVSVTVLPAADRP